jgi:sugar phosphate isomerase/epimerase
LGVQGVEITWPDGASVEDVRRMVEPHGLRVTSISVTSKLADDAFFEPYGKAAARAEQLGAGVLFTSLRADAMPREQMGDRLRRLGDLMARRGVSVALETHPDLCQNGDQALATMAAVGHPNVGVNFDTANIYYYNEGVNTLAELRKINRHVMSVHLKDTMGGFKSPDFPILGLGVVDFAGVFDILNTRGFHGPFTMELEGKGTVSDTEDGMARIISACVEHLREIGKV